jgi:hypothetical protein
MQVGRASMTSKPMSGARTVTVSKLLPHLRLQAIEAPERARNHDPNVLVPQHEGRLAAQYRSLNCFRPSGAVRPLPLLFEHFGGNADGIGIALPWYITAAYQEETMAILSAWLDRFCIASSLFGLTIIAGGLPAHAALCTVAWEPNIETDIAGYYAYQTVAGVMYPDSPVWTGNVTSVTCEQLGITADGKTHYFVVKAYDTSGNVSPLSNEVSKTIPLVAAPPPAPSCLRFAGKSGTCKN